MNLCETCLYRDERGNCTCPKLEERWSHQKDDPVLHDMLLYSYCEGGSFWVGPHFGCVHHQPKPGIKGFHDIDDLCRDEEPS